MQHLTRHLQNIPSSKTNRILLVVESLPLLQKVLPLLEQDSIQTTNRWLVATLALEGMPHVNVTELPKTQHPAIKVMQPTTSVEDLLEISSSVEVFDTQFGL